MSKYIDIENLDISNYIVESDEIYFTRGEAEKVAKINNYLIVGEKMKLSEALKQKSDNWDINKRKVIDNLCDNFYSMLHTGSILKRVEESINNEDILNRYKNFLFEFYMCDDTSVAGLYLMGWEHKEKYVIDLPFGITKKDVTEELMPRMLEILCVYFTSEGFNCSYKESPIHLGEKDSVVKQYVVRMAW